MFAKFMNSVNIMFSFSFCFSILLSWLTNKFRKLKNLSDFIINHSFFVFKQQQGFARMLSKLNGLCRVFSCYTNRQFIYSLSRIRTSDFSHFYINIKKQIMIKKFRSWFKIFYIRGVIVWSLLVRYKFTIQGRYKLKCW